MQNYGIAHVWAQGDFVTRGIALALVIMSVLSWTVIVVKAWNVVRLKRLTHPRAWSQKTAWGTNHVVGNVIIEKEDPRSGDVIARSRFHMILPDWRFRPATAPPPLLSAETITSDWYSAGDEP